MPNIGGASGPPGPPGSGTTAYIVHTYLIMILYCYHTAVVPELGGPGGPLAPPIFGRSVNPIQTRGGQIMPTITTGPPKVFHSPASLQGFFDLCCVSDFLTLTKL